MIEMNFNFMAPVPMVVMVVVVNRERWSEGRLNGLIKSSTVWVRDSGLERRT